MDFVQSYVNEVQNTLARLPWLQIRQAIAVLQSARLNGRQVFLIGNGGSAATASHFASDLGRGVEGAAPPLRARALTDSMAVFSAMANDYGYEQVFSRQLACLLQPGDVVIAISGSGNSPNVLNAVRLAHERGAMTIGLVGFDGGYLREMVDLCIHVENGCIEQVEDVHVLLAHLIATALRQMATAPSSPAEVVVDASCRVPGP